MKKLTYLVANYNCQDYVKDCLESVAAQDSDGWLCIVADDASTDDSLEVIEPYLGQRFNLLKNPKNAGYIETLKRLIEAATTDIVAILDADDALSPGATRHILEAYAENPDAGLVYSRFQFCHEDLSPYKTSFLDKSALLQANRAVPPGRTSLESGYISHIKTFLRNSYYQTEGLDESLLYAEDRDLVYKLEEVTRPVLVDKVLYYYRSRPESQSGAGKKREIGAKNHVEARCRALDRRGITGYGRAAYRIFFWLEYIIVSDRFWKIAKAAAFFVRALIEQLDKRLKIRSGGQLRRHR